MGHAHTDHEDRSAAWRRSLGQNQMNLLGARDPRWWTSGKVPGAEVIRSLPQVATTASREMVLAYFDNSWTLTEVLFSALQGEEAFYRPPYHALRHPLIFYYAHPAVLYINKLRLAGLVDAPVNAEFEALFETGVDEMSWDDMAKNEMKWPSVDQVHAYRAEVYSIVTSIIKHHPDLGAGERTTINQNHPLWALFMGFEHERIHFETSSVLIRELPIHLVRRPDAWPANAPASHHVARRSEQKMVALQPSTVQIGKPQGLATFGWDNEYGVRSVACDRSVEISQHLVSNGEYLDFVRDGGYQNEALWTAKGWQWRKYRNAKHPAFWVNAGPQGLHVYHLRALFEIVPWPEDWPAIVNFHEAQAFASWLTQREKLESKNLCFRLASEAEHHAMRALPNNQVGIYNHGLRFGSESPVTGDSAASREKDIADVFGNVWQWCGDHFYPLPGFKVHKLYDDFSTPCFDGEHHMILGGSFVATGDEASTFARFHFRPHFIQHAGIRLVKSPVRYDGHAVDLRRGVGVENTGETLQGSVNPYETDSLLRDYLVLHFGSVEDQMPYAFGPQGATKFPERCAQLVIDAARECDIPLKKVLDVGCAVGGSTFALAGSGADVIGIDLSDRFIQTAKELKEKGAVTYKLIEEGELGSWREARVGSLEARQRAEFRRGDACALPADFVEFDAVLMANLLCRVPSPLSVLNRMGGPRGVVRKGGLLVLTTPFSWLPQYTPKEVWLGGREENGEALWSDHALQKILAPEFTLLRKGHIPLLIREHRRKFQYIVADSYVFRRNS